MFMSRESIRKGVGADYPNRGKLNPDGGRAIVRIRIAANKVQLSGAYPGK
jgi:hypothetical protein